MKDHQYLDSEDASTTMLMVFSLATEVFRLSARSEVLHRRLEAAGVPPLSPEEESGLDEWISARADELASWVWNPLQPPAEALIDANARYLWTTSRAAASKGE